MESDPQLPAPEAAEPAPAQPLPAQAPAEPPAAVPPAPLAYAPPVPQARLHPLTLFFAGWNSVRGFFIPALVVIFLRRGSGGLGWVPIAATIGAAALAWAMLHYYTFSYWITDAPTGGELILRSGVISRTERHIPLARVQDVRLKQGPMHRLLRMVEVQIETAGGQGAEAKLSVLSQAEATRLRDAIFAHRVVLAGEAPGAAVSATMAADGVPPVSNPSPAPQRRIVRRVSTRELVLAGLTSNQVASGLAVVAGAFALVDDLIDLKTMGPRVAAAERALEQWIATGGPAVVGLLVLGGVVVLALIGLVISVGGSILLFSGFELSLAGEDLHRAYGLFTRHSSSLPRRRIQVLRIEEGLLRRMLKLATLKVNSAGSKGVEDESDKGLDVLLPVVPKQEVLGLLPVVFPEVAEHGNPDWRKVSRRAIWRGTFKGSVMVLAITTGVVLLKGLAALPLLALLPVVYAVNVLGYRNLGYATDAGFFRTRRGWLSRATHVVPVRNVQAVVIRQSPLDRRHGVARVQVDTAGQGGGVGPEVANVHWEEALSLGNELAHKAARERYRW